MEQIRSEEPFVSRKSPRSRSTSPIISNNGSVRELSEFSFTQTTPSANLWSFHSRKSLQNASGTTASHWLGDIFAKGTPGLVCEALSFLPKRYVEQSFATIRYFFQVDLENAWQKRRTKHPGLKIRRPTRVCHAPNWTSTGP
ncbi:MAG: hypothetical protein JWM68_4050 [Verrucomicrobiales bacterium]|nr:hypothetical protein [Verrucomicrobiales bacterium]